jgi:predicted NUDIX family NTP pyrophosphohydrolase
MFVVPKRSAGLLLHRERDRTTQVLLVHPGGPFWVRKDAGAWSVPKGEYDEGDDPLTVARREFVEEIGLELPAGEPLPLAIVKQPSGKVITAFHLSADLDLTGACSNTFELEWPKGSGRIQSFPEVDRVEWFDLDEARRRLIRGQLPFLDHLIEALSLSR